MEKYYIAFYSADCCDEMQLEGIKLFTEETKNTFVKSWKSATRRFAMYAGQWGETEYKKGSSILKDIVFKEISENTYNELCSIFDYLDGLDSFGQFPDYDDYYEEDEDDETEDDE